MAEGIDERVASAEESIKSCKRRLEHLEKQQDAIHDLAASIKVMAAEQQHQTEAINLVRNDVTRLDGKVDALEMKPAKKWDGLWEKALYTAVGALVAWLLVQVGIG